MLETSSSGIDKKKYWQRVTHVQIEHDHPSPNTLSSRPGRSKPIIWSSPHSVAFTFLFSIPFLSNIIFLLPHSHCSYRISHTHTRIRSQGLWSMLCLNTTLLIKQIWPISLTKRTDLITDFSPKYSPFEAIKAFACSKIRLLSIAFEFHRISYSSTVNSYPVYYRAQRIHFVWTVRVCVDVQCPVMLFVTHNRRFYSRESGLKFMLNYYNIIVIWIRCDV